MRVKFDGTVLDVVERDRDVGVAVGALVLVDQAERVPELVGDGALPPAARRRG